MQQLIIIMEISKTLFLPLKFSHGHAKGFFQNL